EFLRRYPAHDLAGNAQYWLGEGYLGLARAYANAVQADKEAEALSQAVQEFRKVLVNYSRADKVSTALYKEALALIELKQPQQARHERAAGRPTGSEPRAPAPLDGDPTLRLLAPPNDSGPERGPVRVPYGADRAQGLLQQCSHLAQARGLSLAGGAGGQMAGR